METECGTYEVRVQSGPSRDARAVPLEMRSGCALAPPGEATSLWTPPDRGCVVRASWLRRIARVNATTHWGAAQVSHGHTRRRASGARRSVTPGD